LYLAPSAVAQPKGAAATSVAEKKAAPTPTAVPTATQPKTTAEVPTSATPQTEPVKAEPAAVMSEGAAVKKAVGRSRQLAALDNAVRAQQRRSECMSCNLNNPELRLAHLSTKYFYPDPDVNKTLRVGMRWQPPRLGELGVNRQREVVDLWRKKVEHDQVRRELVLEVRKTYIGLAYLEESRQLAVKQAELEERRNAAVQRMVGIGQKGLLDQIKGRRRLVKLREEAAKLTQRYQEAKTKLRGLTGEKGEFTAVLGEPTGPAPDFQKLHAQGVKNRRDLTLTEERAKLSDLRYKETRYSQIPWISYVEADYNYESGNLDWGELRVGVEIPVFRWGSAALDATAIAKEGREQYQAATVESIDGEIASALAAYRQALAEWLSLKSETDAYLPSTEGLISHARQQPSIPMSDVIDIELSTIELRQMLLEARYDLAEASIRLCKAVGVDNWQELGK
jgi:hypothetical protein